MQMLVSLAASREIYHNANSLTIDVLVLTSALCLVSILLEEAVDVAVFVNTTSNSASSEGEYSTIGISYAIHPQFDVVTLEVSDSFYKC